MTTIRSDVFVLQSIENAGPTAFASKPICFLTVKATTINFNLRFWAWLIPIPCKCNHVAQEFKARLEARVANERTGLQQVEPFKGALRNNRRRQ